MARLIVLVLILMSLTLGTAVAAQEADEVDIEAAFQQLVAESSDQAAWPNRAAEFLATREDLSIFLMLLEEAQLTETLAQDEGSITIFAPTDAALAGMDQQEFEALFDDAESLRDFLERHIAAGTYTTADLTTSVAGGGQAQEEASAAATPAFDPSSFVTVETRAGTDIEVGPRPTSVRSELSQLEDGDRVAAEIAGGGAAAGIPATLYVDEAQIVERDLAIDGLTLHVIDRVLSPARSGDASER